MRGPFRHAAVRALAAAAKAVPCPEGVEYSSQFAPARNRGKCLNSGLLRATPRHQRAIPCQGMAHDSGKVVITRPPAEFAACLFRSRHDLRRIAWPARRHLDCEIDPRHALDRFDHFEDGVTMAVA